MNQLLEIYSDDIISSFGPTTATNLSRLLEGEISHDQITRFLSYSSFSSSYLWLSVKQTVREIENETGVLIFDDSIVEKPYTKENELITWHYDPSKNRSVKGINILNAIYHVDNVNIPVAFEIINKPIEHLDKKTGQVKRRSLVTKNDLLVQMLKTSHQNNLLYHYVLADNWYASVNNLKEIKVNFKKDFVMAIKSNRLVALSLKDKRQGRFVNIKALNLEPNTAKPVYLKGIDFPILLTKQIFKNKDESQGVLYLICSNLKLTSEQITTLYQKRWNIEVFHKSIKCNTSVAKSPTRMKTTQYNHVFASIYGAFKLELLKLKHHTNHFTLKAQLYLKALQASFAQLQKLTASLQLIMKIFMLRSR